MILLIFTAKEQLFYFKYRKKSKYLEINCFSAANLSLNPFWTEFNCSFAIEISLLRDELIISVLSLKDPLIVI